MLNYPLKNTSSDIDVDGSGEETVYAPMDETPLEKGASSSRTSVVRSKNRRHVSKILGSRSDAHADVSFELQAPSQRARAPAVGRRHVSKFYD